MTTASHNTVFSTSGAKCLSLSNDLTNLKLMTKMQASQAPPAQIPNRCRRLLAVLATAQLQR
jgi:hypothetical protein